MIKKIALDRAVCFIEDLNKYLSSAKGLFEGSVYETYCAREKEIRLDEKNRYLKRVKDILARGTSVDQVTDRDILKLTLGLKDSSVYKGEALLLKRLLDNKPLIQMLMVSCGKVLIGGPSNEKIIESLLSYGADINAQDKNGKTALHYAVESFYNYRIEPLKLIETLLSHGANLSLKDNKGLTPLESALQHCQDTRVVGSEKLMSLLQRALSPEANCSIQPFFCYIKQCIRMNLAKYR